MLSEEFTKMEIAQADKEFQRTVTYQLGGYKGTFPSYLIS